jgi:inosose dehydratase
MKFAFSRPTRDEDQQRLLLGGFREIGYDGLQLKAGQYGGHLADPEGFLAKWGGCPGVSAGLISAGGVETEHLQRLGEVLRFARAVGAELVIYCLMIPREGLSAGHIRGFAHTLSELGRQARDLGTRLSVHNHFNSPVMHRGDFDVFYEAVADGSVGLTLDTAHAVKSGVVDVAEVVRSFAGVIDNFHLKDFDDGQWRLLGEGRIDFEPIFAAIRDIGYNGWVSTDEESGSDLLEGMKTCLAFMKRGLA